MLLGFAEEVIFLDKKTSTYHNPSSNGGIMDELRKTVAHPIFLSSCVFMSSMKTNQ